MKHFVAIFLSLLLVLSQTFAVASPTGGSAAVTSPVCCCNACQCCLGQSDAPVTPAAQAPVSVSAHNPIVLPPTSLVLFTVGTWSDELLPPLGSAEFRAAAVPLFQRNCLFLI